MIYNDRLDGGTKLSEVFKLPIPFNCEAEFGNITIDREDIIHSQFNYLLNKTPGEEITKNKLIDDLKQNNLWWVDYEDK